MNVLVMGQLLLGFLTVVALPVNVLFVRLRWGYRRRVELSSRLGLLLLWLPLVALIVVIGALVLAESSLLSYHASQDMNGLSWFVIGACLMITTDLCMGLAVIALREALKVAQKHCRE